MTNPLAHAIKELEAQQRELGRLLDDMRARAAAGGDGPALVTLKQAAGVTGFSAERIRTWAAAGLIGVAQRHGGQWRIDITALTEYLRTRTRTRGAPR
jgi:Helix-turn-helix domain